MQLERARRRHHAPTGAHKNFIAEGAADAAERAAHRRRRQVHAPRGALHTALAKQGIKRNQQIEIDGMHGTQLYTFIIALEIMSVGRQVSGTQQRLRTR